MAFLSTGFAFIDRIIYGIQDLFTPVVKLPPEGEGISVEMALNSRCTSDYDGNPRKFHWGMFDRWRKLSDEQINTIIGFAKIPRFTDRKVEIRSDLDMLIFIVEKNSSDILGDWIMVESGMQQQAVGLVCAALGVGMVFKNLGRNGTPISNSERAMVRIKLGAMKPTYDGSFWSGLSPGGPKPWLKGNLPDHVRDRDKPLISTLANLKIQNKGSKKATKESISQVLWAARGRTPHFYLSRPSGMTIPTWGGDQHISSIYLIANCTLSKYINWDCDRPTHSILELNKIDKHLFDELTRSYSPDDRFIVLAKNEDFKRSLWEVGYQLLNLLLQAYALNIDYRAFLLHKDQKAIFQDIGIKAPIALLAL